MQDRGKIGVLRQGRVRGAWIKAQTRFLASFFQYLPSTFSATLKRRYWAAFRMTFFRGIKTGNMAFLRDYSNLVKAVSRAMIWGWKIEHTAMTVPRAMLAH